MHKIARNITAVGLCAALCLTGAGAVFARTAGKTENNKSDKASDGTAPSENLSEINKNETVYVLTGADGTVRKIIVSDWIENTSGNTVVSDKTELKDPENVKGSEGYTIDKDNMTVWDAQGNDIYYQGTIDKALPVDMTVSYMLDGKAVTAEDLAGKSGKVTIRFDYRNAQYETVEIDGVKEKIYVPFAMLTGMILDSDTFRNVQVTNGKLLNDGEHTVVVGLSFPGLQENLAIDRETLEIPSFVEITADVTDFAFGMTVTVATNEVFNGMDADRIDISDLSGSVSELTDAMKKLMDGSSALYDGLCTLLERSDELVSGVKALADGAKSLQDGAGKLSSGADRLADGADKLYAGLGTLSSNSADVNSGAAQVFDTLLSAATTQIRAAGISVPDLTVENYAETLDSVIAFLAEDAVYGRALQQVMAGVEGKRSQITQLVTAQVIPAATGLTMDEYSAAVAAGRISAQQQAQLQAIIDQNVEDQIEQSIEETMNSDTVRAQLAAASEGRKTIGELKASLDSYNTFYLGVLSYTGGVDEAAIGAGELQNGAAELKAGAAEVKVGAEKLYGGVLTLQDGIPALLDGMSALRDGAMSLDDGLQQFNEEGIQKLAELIDADLGGIVARLKATADVSRNYTNFSGIADGTDGQVKFVYRTDEVKK